MRWSAVGFALFLVTTSSSAHARPALRAIVHLDAPSHSTLERQRADEWVAECEAPCDKRLVVGPDALYRVRVPSFWWKSSQSFVIAESAVRGDRVNLTFDGWSTVVALSGAVAIPVGLGIVLGGFAVALGSIDCDTNCPSSSTVVALFVAGTVTAGLGLAVLVAGLVGQSTVSDDSSPPSTPESGEHREVSPEARLAPKAFTVPVLSVRF